MSTIFSRNRLMVIVAIITLGIATVMIVRQTRPPRLTKSGQAYFYDLDSRELFTAPGNQLPPITAPSGGRGVLAHIFACDDCGDRSKHVVVYLEMLTEEVQARLLSDTGGDHSSREHAALLDTGLRVAAKPSPGEEPQWVAASSAQGLAIQDQARKLCDGNPARPCKP